MNHYEGMFILHNRELPEEEQAEPVDVVKALLDKVGCTAAHSAVWANRKLAFPIKGNQTGTYVLAYFSCEPAKIAALRRSVAINDRFLREMVFAVDALPEGEAIPGPLTEPGARGGRRPDSDSDSDDDGDDDDKDAKGKARRRDGDKDKDRDRDEESAEDRGPRLTRDERQAERWAKLDYKNVYHLRRMVTAQGKMFGRVRSGLSAMEQRRLRRAVLRARTLALLPYVAR